MKVTAVLALVLAAAPARADTPQGRPPMRPSMDTIRELYEQGDYEGVRRELLKIYAVTPSPQILFALGQVELNLGHYQAAIDYYDKFIATHPSQEQVALAQQAIGAARMRLSEPAPKPEPLPVPVPVTVPVPVIEDKPLPPAPPPEHPPEGRHWTLTHTGFVAFGGAAVLLGTGLLLYSRSLGNDHSGSLSTYDRRIDQAHTTRWTGVGIAAAGTVLIGATLLW